MAVTSKPPQFMLTSFNCPRCGAFAAQSWFELIGSPEGGGTLVNLWDPTYRTWDANVSRWMERTPAWTASKCFACDQHSLWVEERLTYPDPKELPPSELHEPSPDMPADVAVLFREAVAVLPHSKRASAALCRASLERLVKHVDQEAPKGIRLDDRLVRLESRVSSSVIGILNVVRHVGNTALHGESDTDESATIYMDEDDQTIPETFFVAVNVLVDELITKPKRREALYATLPEGVRESYERKAARAEGVGG